MVEYGLILGFVVIFVMVIMVQLYEYGAQNLLGDIEGYEAKSKVELRDRLLNRIGADQTTFSAQYLSGAMSADPSDDIAIY